MQSLQTLALAAGLVLCGGCFLPKSRDTVQEPSEEQLLELYTTTATYLYDDDSLVRAQDQAVKALEIDPENRAMRRMIGWIRLRMGRTEDLIIAEQFFRKLVEEGDRNESTQLGMALVLERLGVYYDRASRAFASGERVPPNGGDPVATSRQVAQRARDLWKESQSAYELTMKNGEGSTQALNGLQRVLALQGGYEESLRWSEELLARSNAEVAAWQRMLTAADLTESEERLFRTNERLSLDLQTDTHLFAATLLNKLERHEEAVKHLDYVVDARPELAQAYGLRAQQLAQLQEYQRAIEDLDRYLKLSDEPFEHPDVRRAFELRSRCESELRRISKG
jgi:tetratricopeptide (TPR) repeat protein